MRFGTLTSFALICSFMTLGNAGDPESRTLPYTPPSGAGGTDVCGEVSGPLKVSATIFPGIPLTIGIINACLCISTLPNFVATNAIALAAVAIAGKPAVIEALTAMIHSSANQQTCRYPDHSVPTCQTGNPCGFTCKDGYSPSPSYHPTSCVCPKPYTVCNGNCGIFKACPSGYAKRELTGNGKRRCPSGLTACGVWGRGSQAWECVDTKSDLESCGGCVVSLHPSLYEPDGIDCAAIRGVSDVSCIGGQCVVHRCMPGHTVNLGRDECVYTKENDPVYLASQFGLENVLVN